MCEVFQQTVAAHPDVVALRTPDDSARITWREYGERVRQIAAKLYALGVRKGDTVALMMTNRPEFHLVDTAVFHLGAIPFSIYNTSSAEQIDYLFGNAENRVVVCEKQFEPLACSAETVLTIEDLADDSPDFDFDATWRAVDPDDVLTLIYTSGTTGPPKGVEITHRNIRFSMAAALEMPQFAAAATDGRVLSYLPDAHLANRYFAHYLPMCTGATTTCVSDPKTVASVLPKVRPTVFLGVPMIWYKIKAGIEQAVAAQTGFRRVIAEWALRAAHHPSGPQYALAQRLVLNKLPAKVGLDACAAPISGAAPISVDALKFLTAAGIPVCEGWAMSESSVHGTVNRPDALKPGTVGKPMPGVEVRLADDGELLLRSPAVMKGYRNDPVKTAEAIDAEGWLHTGDIGTISDDGYVSIVDRKKELIINAAGKNMSPANIENAVKVASPLIGSVVAIGDRRPYVVALITLDPETGTDPHALAQDPEIVEAVTKAVREANATLSRVEQIKAFRILPTFWLPGGNELTPTMKLKRKPIAELYAAEIDALYSER
ncbi:AMP-dependent synthetase/ligase [Kibdelosporangium aridum]|uniref:AMP-dependent synthetase/ligase n=1 Tax=Kibdelosporangium aridum TaxID=2030 RepID=UPI0005271FB2